MNSIVFKLSLDQIGTIFRRKFTPHILDHLLVKTVWVRVQNENGMFGIDHDMHVPCPDWTIITRGS